MFQKRFHDLSSVIASCSYTDRKELLEEDEALRLAFKLISETKGIVYVIGNGGSAGIASHFSTDLLKTLHIPSQTLYDSNLLTCLSNDLGYENVFSHPLKKLLKPSDLLVAISSSGKSLNIINAVQEALIQRTPVITLSGFLEENPLRQMGHLNFWIDRCDYGLVEMAHFFLLHTLVDLWDKHAFFKEEHASILS